MTDDRLSQLYRTYGSVIHDRCRSMLEDAAEAEDATHETFLRLHRQLARLPDAHQAVFWIYRVATNYCLTSCGTGSGGRRPPIRCPSQPPRSAHDPERPIADRDLARRLIESAPAKVRAVAWLYHVDGFQRDEVAAILGVSERTITTRLAAFASGARKYLRERAACDRPAPVPRRPRSAGAGRSPGPDATTRAALEQHLGGCAACQERRQGRAAPPRRLPPRPGAAPDCWRACPRRRHTAGDCASRLG